jgi:hypothetical protein
MLIESIRTFGGTMSKHPVWLFEADPQKAPCGNLRGPNVHVFPLNLAGNDYYFWDKVYACARAEEMADDQVQSLIWIDPSCLVINPPLLFNLNSSYDAAVRPVHIRNVGLIAGEPLDGFWKKVYEVVGVEDVSTTVETFVDAQRIRSYFNSHAFSVDPSKGLLPRWLEYFERLVGDQRFQSTFCLDELHQIFLHQAVLSALFSTTIDAKRLKILPPEYNYPYNLHPSVPEDRRAPALNDLVCIAYEDRSLDPDLVDDINIREPLRSWLAHQHSPS